MITSIVNNRQLVSHLYEKYLPEVRLYFAHYTRDMAAAEDMAQDLFIKVLALDVINAATAKSLLLTIAHRMIVDDVRHRAFVKRQLDGMEYTMESTTNVTAGELMTCKQIEQSERRFVELMPRQRAMVYSLSRYDELSVQEIAERMELSKRTVESHLYVSRRNVRDYLRGIV